MPRPKVWGDFTVNDAFEGTDDAGDDLVEFTCPYNCGKPIRMKERNVIKNNDALRRQVDELRQSAGSQPKVSTHRDRKLMRLFHPDNYTNAPAEVRTKMVEAYRLVSESRPDA